jgi:NAD(P)-dependent dehydrogenase (short-subunit alcohol dehydrogenase family)
MTGTHEGAAVRSVMITGASTGIGRETALLLCSQGWRVFAGVRRISDGQALKDAAAGPGQIVSVLCDVTDSESVAGALETVTAALAGDRLDGFFSNAGIAALSGDASAEGTPTDILEKVMAVNYLGAVRAVQAFLPLLRAARGTLIVNSAMMTRTVLPFNGGYAPSKAALETWAVGLRREIAPLGVKVVIIRAAGVATGLEAKQHPEQAPTDGPYPQQAAFLARGLRMQREHAHSPALSPRRVAQCVADALNGRTSRYRQTGGGHLPIWLLGGLPASMQDAIIGRLVTTWSKLERNRD